MRRWFPCYYCKINFSHFFISKYPQSTYLLSAKDYSQNKETNSNMFSDSDKGYKEKKTQWAREFIRLTILRSGFLEEESEVRIWVLAIYWKKLLGEGDEKSKMEQGKKWNDNETRIQLQSDPRGSSGAGIVPRNGSCLKARVGWPDISF